VGHKKSKLPPSVPGSRPPLARSTSKLYQGGGERVRLLIGRTHTPIHSAANLFRVRTRAAAVSLKRCKATGHVPAFFTSRPHQCPSGDRKFCFAIASRPRSLKREKFTRILRSEPKKRKRRSHNPMPYTLCFQLARAKWSALPPKSAEWATTPLLLPLSVITNDASAPNEQRK
jgi:hypothetical protein